jgi:hypothetical protein
MCSRPTIWQKHSRDLSQVSHSIILDLSSKPIITRLLVPLSNRGIKNLSLPSKAVFSALCSVYSFLERQAQRLSEKEGCLDLQIHDIPILLLLIISAIPRT